MTTFTTNADELRYLEADARPTGPVCFWCGCSCTGDVTETVNLYDAESGEVAICDDPDSCPANL
jgi:hypothetical protein